MSVWRLPSRTVIKIVWLVLALLVLGYFVFNFLQFQTHYGMASLPPGTSLNFVTATYGDPLAVVRDEDELESVRLAVGAEDIEPPQGGPMLVYRYFGIYRYNTICLYFDADGNPTKKCFH